LVALFSAAFIIFPLHRQEIHRHRRQPGWIAPDCTKKEKIDFARSLNVLWLKYGCIVALKKEEKL